MSDPNTNNTAVTWDQSGAISPSAVPAAGSSSAVPLSSAVPSTAATVASADHVRQLESMIANLEARLNSVQLEQRQPSSRFAIPPLAPPPPPPARPPVGSFSSQAPIKVEAKQAEDGMPYHQSNVQLPHQSPFQGFGNMSPVGYGMNDNSSVMVQSKRNVLPGVKLQPPAKYDGSMSRAGHSKLLSFITEVDRYLRVYQIDKDSHESFAVTCENYLGCFSV